MKSTKIIIYEETQKLTLINITFLVLYIALIILYISTKSYEKTPILLFVFILVFSLIPVILFFKMDTKLTNEELIISYGIGIVKKTYKNNTLNYSNIQQEKIPWFLGVGIRIANDGIIYNAQPGTAIKIQKTNSKKHIYIGTKNEIKFTEAFKVFLDSKINY